MRNKIGKFILIQILAVASCHFDAFAGDCGYAHENGDTIIGPVAGSNNEFWVRDGITGHTKIVKVVPFRHGVATPWGNFAFAGGDDESIALKKNILNIDLYRTTPFDKPGKKSPSGIFFSPNNPFGCDYAKDNKLPNNEFDVAIKSRLQNPKDVIVRPPQIPNNNSLGAQVPSGSAREILLPSNATGGWQDTVKYATAGRKGNSEMHGELDYDGPGRQLATDNQAPKMAPRPSCARSVTLQEYIQRSRAAKPSAPTFRYPTVSSIGNSISNAFGRMGNFNQRFAGAPSMLLQSAPYMLEGAVPDLTTSEESTRYRHPGDAGAMTYLFGDSKCASDMLSYQFARWGWDPNPKTGYGWPHRVDPSSDGFLGLNYFFPK